MTERLRKLNFEGITLFLSTFYTEAGVNCFRTCRLGTEFGLSGFRFANFTGYDLIWVEILN